MSASLPTLEKPAKRKLKQLVYFTKNDIYHPKVNPNGKHEKRYKRMYYAKNNA